MLYIWGTPIVTTVESILYDMKREMIGQELFRDIKPSGENIMVTCPFHSGGRERKASFGVATREITYNGRVLEAGSTHCFTCGYKSDLPQFIADVLELDNRIHGFKWLKERYMYGAGDERGELGLDFSRGKQSVEEGEGLVSKVLVTHYHEELLNSQRALDYVIGRKLDNLHILEIFGVGYDEEKDSIVFAVADKKGQTRMLKKRSIEGKRFANTTGSNKAGIVYGLYQLLEYGDKTKPVWICESEIDCLTAWHYGVQAVAVMGSHISEAQVKELSKTPFRHLVDGLDRDEAGRKGWRTAKDLLIPLGFRMWNTKGFGEKKDINDLTHNEFLQIEKY